jgi:type IV pilus assembly protein PilB
MHRLIPVAYVNNALTLAMVNPSNLVAFDDVRRYVKGAIIEPKVCTEDDFRKFMDSIYPQLMGLDKSQRIELEKKSTEERRERKEERRKQQTAIDLPLQSFEDLQNEILTGMEVQADEEEKVNAIELTTASEDAPVVRLANNILAVAIKKGASDIHIEPQEKGVMFRLRVDGILKVENVLSKKIQLPLISRLKILARLDISERRMPQDGESQSRSTIDPSIFEFPQCPQSSVKKSSCVSSTRVARCFLWIS